METLELFQRTLEYNLWANLRALDSLRSTNPTSAKATSALMDILLVEGLWLARLRGEDTGKVASDVFRQVPELGLAGMIENSFAEYDAYLKTLDEPALDAVYEFTMHFDEPCRMTRREMLAHIFNQSMYHRGQLNMIVDDEGGEPFLLTYASFMQEMGTVGFHATEQ